MKIDGLQLDEDGIPLLTNSVSPDDSGIGQETADRLPATSAPELMTVLLDSEALRQKLDEIAARMTVNARQDMETAIRPAIEEAITQSLNVSGDNIYLAISKQLESALPDILPHVLQANNAGEN
ncbi:MAG: hypothetical protein OEN52_00320 [Gammaproteobacteria bacterium]|nr:hypothetical protein [Gammaproteobacteria bacterium]MDH3559386.1 hypothetical protein [Gammaproteobacteria bacterium]